MNVEEIKISFYRRANTLQIRINGGQRQMNERFSAKIKIPPEIEFDIKSQKALGRTSAAQRINNQIAKKKAEIIKACERYPGDVTQESLTVIKSMFSDGVNKQKIFIPTENPKLEILAACQDYYEKCKQGIIRNKRTNGRYSEATIQNYKKVVDLVDETLVYGDQKNKVFISDWDLSYAKNDLEEKKKRVAKTDQFFNLFLEYMDEMEFFYNTQFSRFHILKKMVNYHTEENFLTVKSNITTPSPDDNDDENIIVLPFEMVTELMKWKIRSFSLDKGLKMAYDYIMLVLFSAKRINDIWNLSEDDYSYKSVQDFKASDENSLPVNRIVPYIAKKSKKTLSSTTAIFPAKLDNLLNENLNRFGSRFGPLRREEYPNLNNWNSALRYHLERFFMQFDCMHEPFKLERVNPITRKTKVRNGPYYKFAGPHTLRRTAISFMLAMGMSETHVKKFSGHTKDSKSFKKYHHVYANSLIEDTSKFFDKTNSDSIAIPSGIEIVTVYRMPDNSVVSYDKNNERIPELSGKYTDQLMSMINMQSGTKTEWIGFDKLRSVSG